MKEKLSSGKARLSDSLRDGRQNYDLQNLSIVSLSWIPLFIFPDFLARFILEIVRKG